MWSDTTWQLYFYSVDSQSWRRTTQSRGLIDWHLVATVCVGWLAEIFTGLVTIQLARMLQSFNLFVVDFFIQIRNKSTTNWSTGVWFHPKHEALIAVIDWVVVKGIWQWHGRFWTFLEAKIAGNAPIIYNLHCGEGSTHRVHRQLGPLRLLTESNQLLK